MSKIGFLPHGTYRIRHVASGCMSCMSSSFLAGIISLSIPHLGSVVGLVQSLDELDELDRMGGTLVGLAHAVRTSWGEIPFRDYLSRGHSPLFSRDICESA